jgi:hypothetical protein
MKNQIWLDVLINCASQVFLGVEDDHPILNADLDYAIDNIRVIVGEEVTAFDGNEAQYVDQAYKNMRLVKTDFPTGIIDITASDENEEIVLLKIQNQLIELDSDGSVYVQDTDGFTIRLEACMYVPFNIEAFDRTSIQ